MTYIEYARLVSHRARLLLDNLINHIEFDDVNEDISTKKAIYLIKKATEELIKGHDLLNHVSDDNIGYFDSKEKKLVTIERN